jgi:hypothetical protein
LIRAAASETCASLISPKELRISVVPFRASRLSHALGEPFRMAGMPRSSVQSERADPVSFGLEAVIAALLTVSSAGADQQHI